MFKPHHNIIMISLLLLFSINAVAKEAASLTEHVTHQYLTANFGPEKKDDTSAQQANTNLGFIDQIKKNFDTKKQILTPREIQEIVCNLVAKNSVFKTDIVDFSVINKMEIIGGGENAQSHLLNKIFNLNTSFGKSFTAFTFCHPIKDISILTNRQNAIIFLSNNTTATHAIDSALKKINTVEEKSLFFWGSKPPVNPDLLKTLYFGSMIDLGGMLKKLNTSPIALEIMGRSLSTFQSSTFLLGQLGFPCYLIHKYAQYEKIGYLEAVSTIACACKDIFKTIPFTSQVGFAIAPAYLMLMNYLLVINTKMQAEICDHLQGMLIAAATHIDELKKLSKIVNKNKVLLTLLPSLKPLAQLTNNTHLSAKLTKLLGMLNTNTFKGEPSFFSYTGRILAAYELMKQVKDELAPALVAAGELDMYVALAKLYNSHEDKQARYCMAEFIENKTPIIDVHAFWNPFINPDIVVVNDALFDVSNPNSILTGPNTGGKSTVIKAIFINTLMAQTFGIAPSQSLKLTPFSTLDCFMNISDDIAMGTSLFKAEVARAKKILKMIEDLNNNEFSFIIIDEIFTGTSPQEGEIAACRFAKQLGNFANNVSIVATHYPKMIDLEDETDGRYRNHHIEILRNEDGSLNRTFKFKEGASRMNVAFDILAEEGINLIAKL